MFQIFILASIFGLIGGIEIPPMIKNKKWKEFAVYSLFFMMALFMLILDWYFDVDFIRVSKWFIEVFGI
jgi:hypothetical protein